ncbi:MAG TPA: addiction module protein [Fimbriiglobus sp.]|jgi:putative addiction module component (TIGR02574 family)|nr:addiction module protein [Fimbriiglobus sp.]
MDLSATLAQINMLSPDDRIRLVQAIWDSIPEEDRAPDLTDEQKAELDRRLADLRANPQIGLTWEQVKARVKGGR